MNRFDLLSDIRDLIRGCLGAGCEYKLVITRGKPPQECNMVALWAGRDTVQAEDDCRFCDKQFEMLVYLYITRICASGRSGASMDFRLEEEQALCFYRDLDLIECCIDDADTSQILADHTIDVFERVSTEPDRQMSGDTYAATITLRVRGEQCCEQLVS